VTARGIAWLGITLALCAFWTVLVMAAWVTYR